MRNTSVKMEYGHAAQHGIYRTDSSYGIQVYFAKL